MLAVGLSGRDMMIRLSDKEASIILGATLMHWGVPFRSATRRELTEHQQALVDEASEKLIGLRETYQRSPGQEPLEVPLEEQEAVLLIAVIEDCLHECGNNPTELSLQLKTSKRNEVETLLERLCGSLGARCTTRP
jgi:hypothetical protein